MLAPEGGLALTVVAWISNGVAFRVSQEGQESNINADIGMLAHAWGMLILSFSLTDDEGIPVSISMQNEMGCLGCSFERAVQFDLDGTTQLLGNGQMFPIRVKREISLVLPQLDGMPPIGFLVQYFTANELSYQVGVGPSHPTPKRNASFIPMSEAQGLSLAEVGKNVIEL